MRREGGEEGREVLYLVCLEPNTQERERERHEKCFTEESKGGRARLLRAHAHAMFRGSLCCTYTHIQKKEKPWALGGLGEPGSTFHYQAFK